MQYEPNFKSLKQHQAPAWHQDAKLGIFIHWGLYSVPAYAPTKYGDITQTVGDHGYEFHFTHNPYAEWYQNSLRTGGEDYLQYHKEKFGENFPYEKFAEIFDEEVKKWDPKEWAQFFKKIGAKYVVLTTKHHEGFTLWPSKTPNHYRPNYHATRNIVGELTEAVRSVGLRMGTYYSGGLDWTFNPNPIKETTTMLSNAPSSKEYGAYVDAHMKELTDTFKPDVLWNDIAYPVEGKLFEIIAYYYNHVPDGVVNDRYTQIPKIAGKLEKTKLIKKLINYFAQRVVKNHGFEGGPPKRIGDYSTPEYEPNTHLRSYKWEACRGIGRSFGFNQMETADHYLSNQDLIHSFIDIVSKNGNLLLNIGPKADGTIPEIQKERLEALGDFLKKNGEGIYGTRPWIQSEATSDVGIPIRFTQKESCLFVFLLGIPRSDKITIAIPNLSPIQSIQKLGDGDSIPFEQSGSNITLVLPSENDAKYAVGYKITLKQ
jgi:alpha-L-fucosidase